MERKAELPITNDSEPTTSTAADPTTSDATTSLDAPNGVYGGTSTITSRSGRSLDDGIRNKCETAFAASLANVHVHEDGVAEQLGVRAVARGASIHFARGCYDPSSADGQHLIAHELAHVVQQGAAGKLPGPTHAGEGSPQLNVDGSLEDEAEQAAHAAMSGKHATLSRGAVATSFQGAPAKKSAGPTGDQYIDHGAVCKEGETTPDCFLDGDQRGRLIQSFKDRMLRAEKNYQLALTQLKVDKLIEKEEDLSWVMSLVLDVASLALAGALAKGLLHLKKLGDQALARRVTLAAINGKSADWAARLHTAVGKVSSTGLEAGIGKAAELAKAQAVEKAQAVANAPTADQKTGTIAYIDQLTDEAGVTFQTISERTPGMATDAELLLLWESLDAQYHAVSMYKTTLGDKVQRFSASGVANIGRNNGGYMSHDDKGHLIFQTASWVDTRVVWVTFTSGRPKQLWYERQYKAKGTVPPRKENERKFDVPNWDLVDDKLYYPGRVPTEFVDVALQRHNAQWDTPPATKMVADWQWHGRLDVWEKLPDFVKEKDSIGPKAP